MSLHGFAVTDGAAPSAALVAANGKFYGTTDGRRQRRFRDDLQHRFGRDVRDAQAPRRAGTGTRRPRALILASDGKLYGTTSAGGTSDLGTLFKVDFAGTLTTLHPLAASEGAAPVGNLVQGTDLAFYGTTRDGGATGRTAPSSR